MVYPIIIIFTVSMAALIAIYVKGIWTARRRSHRHRKFSLSVFFQQQNKFIMSENVITLTDLNPHTGTIVLIDNFGNQYTGKLSNATIGGFDSALDKVSIDPANPEQLDVQSLTDTGTTEATLTGDWTSEGNTTSRPNPDPTKPASVAMPDGTVHTGVSCKISITNNISRTFSLAVNF